MTDKVFLDTNILVYAYDSYDPAKQSIAQRLVADVITSETGVISAQILSEFFVTVTRRIQNLLSIEEARQVIELFDILPVVPIDMTMIRRAIDTHKGYQINYWDALIIAAAERSGCGRIASEDLNAGQVYHDIIVENPFSGR